VAFQTVSSGLPPLLVATLAWIVCVVDTTKNYLTYEKTRQRYVFQLHVPEDLRGQYNGRTRVRKSLGNIPYEQAVARARDLAAQYHDEFTRRRPAPTLKSSVPAIRLTVTDETGSQLAATWQRQAANHLADQLTGLQKAPAEAWDAEIADAQSDLASAREQLRRGDNREFEIELDRLQLQHGFLLEGEKAALAGVARQFNAVRVAYLSAVVQILEGGLGIDAITPPRTAQLPLVSLWGTPASDLPESWASRKRSIGLAPNAKTLDKYRLIARDCDAVLNGRPVEDLCDDDLTAIKAYWCAQGNGPSTVVCKLDLLKQLVRQLAPNDRLERCFEAARPVGGKLKTKRLPFTREQVCALVSEIHRDPHLCEDDKRLVDLLLLTAARLEELCQLTTEDIAICQDHWQLRIASGHDTGTQAAIKNSASARRLMIPLAVLPRLDAWLNERIAAGGRLFPNLTTDKYGRLGNAVSKRLNSRLRRILGPDRRLVLLSSRPTGNRVMRRAGVDPRVRHRQLGHADQGIHDQHYDAAEHFDDEDLLPGAAVMAEWLADCIGPDAVPGIDRQARGNDSGVGEPDMHVVDEGRQPTGAPQHLTVERQHPGVAVATTDALEPRHPPLVIVGGLTSARRSHNNAGVGVAQNEVNRIAHPPRSPLRQTQAHVDLKTDAGKLEQASDDQLRGGFDGTAGGRIAAGRPVGYLAGNSLQKTQLQRRTVSHGIDVAPDFEATGIKTALEKAAGILRIDTASRDDREQAENRIEPSRGPQELGGVRMPMPEFNSGLDAAIQGNRHEIHHGHLLEEVDCAYRRPTEQLGHLPTHERVGEAAPELRCHERDVDEGGGAQRKNLRTQALVVHRSTTNHFSHDHLLNLEQQEKEAEIPGCESPVPDGSGASRRSHVPQTMAHGP